MGVGVLWYCYYQSVITTVDIVGCYSDDDDDDDGGGEIGNTDKILYCMILVSYV